MKVLAQVYVKRLTVAYYKVLDVTQRNWHRFRQTEVGEATVWLAPRALKATWFVTKWMLVICGVMMLIPFVVLFGIFLAVTGNTKELIKATTKITIAVIGFVAADRLLERRLANKPNR